MLCQFPTFRSLMYMLFLLIRYPMRMTASSFTKASWLIEKEPVTLFLRVANYNLGNQSGYNVVQFNGLSADVDKQDFRLGSLIYIQ